MKVLGINFSHDASFSIIENDEIIFYQEESMLSGIKKDHNINHLWNYIKNNKFNTIIFSQAKLNNTTAIFYKEYIKNKCLEHNISYDEIIYNLDHHLQHAACAYFNSGFDKAYCLVMDGSGTAFYYKNKKIGYEIESIFEFNKKIKLKWKVCMGEDKTYTKNVHTIQSISPALLFKFAAKCIGSNEPGAVMGMSSYGTKQTGDVLDEPIFYNNNNLYKVNQGFLWDIHEGHIDKFKFSKSIQEQSKNIVLKRIEKLKKHNLCLSGGFFQNCQINNDVLSVHKNVFVDPLAHDGGTSLGLALLVAFKNNIKVKPYKNLYLGIKPLYPKNIKKNTSVEEVAKLLKENNIVGIFQGRQEAGPRALGNRSILYNPLNFHAKDIVNTFKKREWYRPFAGTVLHEHANDWFDLNGKEEIPYMSYAVKVKKFIPGITHVDKSCRVQTLKKEQNKSFYELIQSFYKLSGIPILLNTSLNISGKPLIGTFEQAVDMFKSSSLKYLYFPDIQFLLKK
jgi:carbamoyltransferase